MTRQLKIIDLLYFKGKIRNKNIKLEETKNKDYDNDFIVLISVMSPVI